MKREDVEKYLRVLKLDPAAKYMLIVSKDSGLHGEDLERLKLSDQFLDEILLIEGDVVRMVEHIQITKK